MFNDYLHYKTVQREKAQTLCAPHPLAVLTLKPLTVGVIADNKQAMMHWPFSMSKAVVDTLEPAEINPVTRDWGVFDRLFY